jgi:hypothetical protein
MAGVKSSPAGAGCVIFTVKGERLVIVELGHGNGLCKKKARQAKTLGEPLIKIKRSELTL